MCQYIVLTILLCTNLLARADQGPLLAAASSLRSLWPELMQSYTLDTTEQAPRVSFGSSGLLSTQILNGAPFEVFLSADLASINRLPVQFLDGEPQVYATGELHLVVPESSPLAESLSLVSLAAALSVDGGNLRLAIPNPIHAPYGKAAQEALENAGIWPLPVKQLLAAENASQTLQFVRSGAVAAAIVPQALLNAENESVVSVVIPSESYRPVEHFVAVFKVAGRSAHAFRRWLLSEDARHILEDSGLRVATSGSRG